MTSINLNRMYADIDNLQNYISNPILTGFLTMLVIFYSGVIAPYLSSDIASIINSAAARIAFLFVVMTVRQYNPLAALIINAVAFVILFALYLKSPVQNNKIIQSNDIQMDTEMEMEMEEVQPPPTPTPEQTEAASIFSQLQNDMTMATEEEEDSSTKIGGTISNIVSDIVSRFNPSDELRYGIQNPMVNAPKNDIKFSNTTVQHPDSAYNMSNNPNPPYQSYNTNFTNVDVDLKKLNPIYGVKNLPTNYSGDPMFSVGASPHTPTPHADNRPSLKPISFNENIRKIALKLNPPVESFSCGCSAPAVDDLDNQCLAGGNKKKKQTFYARNYHAIGGVGSNIYRDPHDVDPSRIELIQQKYVENESALNNIVQNNVGMLISTLIAELKFTLSDKEIREDLCDIIKTIIRYRNTTIREFFSHDETYRAFMKLVLLVADKVENSTSMAIINEVFSKVYKDMKHIFAVKLDSTINQHFNEISEIKEKVKNVNLDQICNFQTDTIGINQGIQLYGGNKKYKSLCATNPSRSTNLIR